MNSKGEAGKGKEIGSAEGQLAQTSDVQHSVTEASSAQGKTRASQALHVPMVAVGPDTTQVQMSQLMWHVILLVSAISLSW